MSSKEFQLQFEKVIGDNPYWNYEANNQLLTLTFNGILVWGQEISTAVPLMKAYVNAIEWLKENSTNW